MTPKRPSHTAARRALVLGYSVQHRAIIAIEMGDPDSPAHTVVVGCIHGNEPAGTAIATALGTHPVPAEADLWVIADLNPDGVAAGTRGNAHGVDLNRNFPFTWRPLGPPGSLYYAGPHPLSEPESRLAAALVRRLRPRLTIYYHQHLAVVDDSQGPRSIERATPGLQACRSAHSPTTRAARPGGRTTFSGRRRSSSSYRPARSAPSRYRRMSPPCWRCCPGHELYGSPAQSSELTDLYQWAGSQHQLNSRA